MDTVFLLVAAQKRQKSAIISNQAMHAGRIRDRLFATGPDQPVQTHRRDAERRRHAENALAAANQAGMTPDRPGHQLLEAWLHVRPAPALFEAWKDYVHALTNTLDPRITALLEPYSPKGSDKLAAKDKAADPIIVAPISLSPWPSLRV